MRSWMNCQFAVSRYVFKIIQLLSRVKCFTVVLLLKVEIQPIVTVTKIYNHEKN